MLATCIAGAVGSAVIGWMAGAANARRANAHGTSPQASQMDPASAHRPLLQRPASDPALASAAQAPRPDRGTTPTAPLRLDAACSGVRTASLDPACTAALADADLRDASARRQLLALLSSERSPVTKAAIFNAVQPMPLAREDLAPILQELRAVHDAGDPDLRAAALVHWAQWDRSDDIAPLLRDALYDDDPRVVQGGVSAVALSNVRSQDVKEALLLLANDASPDSETRVAALQALRDFSLSRAEDAIVRNSEAALPAAIR